MPILELSFASGEESLSVRHFRIREEISALPEIRILARSELEDIDFSGYFCYPDCAALGCYVQLYTETTRRRGVDANIGPRLPSLLAEAGFENIQVNIVQPSGFEGEVKHQDDQQAEEQHRR